MWVDMELSHMVLGFCDLFFKRFVTFGFVKGYLQGVKAASVQKEGASLPMNIFLAKSQKRSSKHKVFDF